MGSYQVGQMRLLTVSVTLIEVAN